MLYLLCIIFPPLAVLLAGRPLSALLNVLLTLCFYVPGVIHAFLVVGDAKAAARNKKLIRAIQSR
jgi:uncharacterized membrane protein YqaE (UPF0057 family)